MADESVIPPSPSVEEYGVADDQGQVFTSGDPLVLFREWFDLAKTHEMNDANAMSLATVDASDMPNVRIVLLKDVSDDGFSFFSNAESAKGQELASRPQAALCFHWKSIRRQVRVRGVVSSLAEAESDSYFATRARGSQIGAWASFQSRPLAVRAELKQRIADYEAIYKDKKVPRPDYWQGWMVKPQTIEFWVNRPYRLHERLVFSKGPAGWSQTTLYP